MCQLHRIELDIAGDGDPCGVRPRSDQVALCLFGLCADGVKGADVVTLKQPTLNAIHSACCRIVVEPRVDQHCRRASIFSNQQEGEGKAARRIGRPARNLGHDQVLWRKVFGERSRVGAMAPRDANFGCRVTCEITVAIVGMVCNQDKFEFWLAGHQLAQQRVNGIEFADG